MATSRQKIINFITDQQYATVEELSRAFRVTQANIRHHLSILVDQGSVEVVGLKPAPIKGRPSQIFSVTHKIGQENVEMLADILMSEIMNGIQIDDRKTALKRIAALMVSKFQVNSSNPTRRLYSTIRILNQMNYRAHWEAHIEHPQIMLDHCPYRSLQERHSELCHLDQLMLEALLCTPVELVEKNSPNLKGFPHCVFIYKAPI